MPPTVFYSVINLGGLNRVNHIRYFSVEKALEIVDSFGMLAGLKLNRKKTKAIWLGKWENCKSNPLQLKWLHNPAKILGIYVSYDEKGNNQHNFNHKLQKLQTNLDLWRARDLTLFGRVLIIKSLALSQLVYSASNLNVPQEIMPIIKTKLFKFLWKNKNDKIKREGLYQDRDKGGIRMTDVEIMIKVFLEVKMAKFCQFSRFVSKKCI